MAGDLGEFIISLIGYINYFNTPVKIGKDRIKNALSNLISKMNEKFYYCLDFDKVKMLSDSLDIDYLDIGNPNKQI